jgi:hypothetical protein
MMGRQESFSLIACYIFLVYGGGIRLSLLGTLATNWHVVPSPNDRWEWRIWWNENWQGKPECPEESCPSATFSTSNSTWLDLGLNSLLFSSIPLSLHLSPLLSHTVTSRTAMCIQFGTGRRVLAHSKYLKNLMCVIKVGLWILNILWSHM